MILLAAYLFSVSIYKERKSQKRKTYSETKMPLLCTYYREYFELSEQRSTAWRRSLTVKENKHYKREKGNVPEEYIF